RSAFVSAPSGGRLFANSANRRSISLLRRFSSSVFDGGGGGGGGAAVSGAGAGFVPGGSAEGSSLVETGTATGPEGGSEISGGLWSQGGCRPASVPGAGEIVE